MALAPRSEANQIASLGLNSTSGNNGLNRRNPLTGGPIQALLRWLFHQGACALWPAAIFSIGDFHEPTIPYLPSMLF
jgi:hypothetical protein